VQGNKRAIARQTRTAVITWKDGKVVRTYPHREGDGQAEQSGVGCRSGVDCDACHRIGFTPGAAGARFFDPANEPEHFIL
jgi:hypothetical protein